MNKKPRYLKKHPAYHPEFLEFASKKFIKPMTNTQFKFANWLLTPAVTKKLMVIGDLESIFIAVRHFRKEIK